MADFCKQCGLDIFGEDFKNLAGISTEKDTRNGLFASVLCEGCGPTQVDHQGVCVAKNCFRRHGNQAKPGK